MRAEELEALREDMLAVIAAGAFALRDTIGKSALDERVITAIRTVQEAVERILSGQDIRYYPTPAEPGSEQPH